VDKSEILTYRNDPSKTKLLEMFFDWHQQQHIPVKFITQKEFQNLHQGTFKAIEVNDFVFFDSDGFAWVVGTVVDYTKPLQINDKTILRAVDDCEVVKSHKEFVLTLNREAKQIKNPSALFIWCVT
jgi:hypothetical protein